MTTRSDSEALFDCYYFNLAWGLRIYGFIITADGSVCRYGMQKGKQLPKFTSPNGTFQEFIRNCHKDFTIIDKIDLKELSESAALIPEASQGKIDRSPGAFDAGSTYFLAYITGEGKRKEVPLQQLGDEILTNHSPEADTLIKWLNPYWAKVKNMFIAEFYPS